MELDLFQLEEIKKALLNHQVIAFPTETVMGFGVIFNDEIAYNRLNEIKGKREDKPYTLMLGDVKEINKYGEVNDTAKKIIDNFMPGSVTLILKKKNNVPDYITHGRDTVGIRIPSNSEALSLLKYIGVPLLVPSANRSGNPPCLNSDEVTKLFKDELGYIVEGSSTSFTPSTIIDVSDGDIKILREGAVGKETILSLLELL